jgi:hypothetical protein
MAPRTPTRRGACTSAQSARRLRVRARRAVLWATATVGAVTLVACENVSSSPNVPASIEFAPLAFPSVAVGDVLRDTLGTPQPFRAIVRNVAGDVIEDAPVRYLYVQFARDSALQVDSLTGAVRALKVPTGSPVQIAALYEPALLIVRDVKVSRTPDTVFVTTATRPLLQVSLPDTGRQATQSNSAPVDVRLQYRDSTGALKDVSDWLVRFAVTRPANLRNDTAAAVYVISENGTPGQTAVTTGGGTAARRIRVRADRFPAAGTTVDTVVVEAVAVRRGVPVPGAPVQILVPVSRRP